jgi:hypothetical protein
MEVFSQEPPYFGARLMGKAGVNSIEQVSARGIGVNAITEILVCGLERPYQLLNLCNRNVLIVGVGMH